MYYEEKVIDGQLCYRTTPDGPWAVVQYQELIRRLLAAEKRYRTFDQAREALKDACLTYAVHGDQPPQKWLDALAAMEGKP